MRLIVIGIVLGLLSPVSTALAQDCAGYPASQTWVAGNGYKISESDGGLFPGFKINDLGDLPSGALGTLVLQNHPVTVDGLTAETDILNPNNEGESLKIKYSTDRWAGPTSYDVSFVWKLYLTEVGGGAPQIKIRNGAKKFRLNFDTNITDQPGCTISGWEGDEGAVITSGGMRIPNSSTERYLPMTVGAWYTIRVDVHGPAQAGDPHTFDVYVNNHASDQYHVAGYLTEDTGSQYVQFGVTSSEDIRLEFSTACAAWAEGTDIPPAPAVQELCTDGIDNDGDGDVDCADSACDCSIPDDVCQQVTDIFENFNVNFVESAGSGLVPPGWERSGYAAPASTDEDRASVFSLPDSSAQRLSPSDLNFGPYYYYSPGPYEEEQPELEDLYNDCRYAPPLPTSAGELYDRQWGCTDATGVHWSQPIRFGLILGDGQEGIPGVCGTGPECMAGLINVEQQAPADDFAALPIDWTKPVEITIEALGNDLGAANGNTYKWATYIDYLGYANKTTTANSVEWGLDGDQPNIDDGGTYQTLSLTLNDGTLDAGVTAPTLVFGVDFDYIGATLPTDKISQAFFENISITYYPDLTKPLIHLNKMSIEHTIPEGSSLPDDTFTVKNAIANTTLNYTVSDDVAWLSTSGGDGTSVGEEDTISISYDGVASLTEGVYEAVVSVDSTQINKSPADLFITLNVVGPVMTLSESAFTHDIGFGGSIADDTFTVANTGGGSFSYTVSDDASWLSVTPVSGGPLGNGDSDLLTVDYDVTGLLPGPYSATITVDSADPNVDNVPSIIDVTLNINVSAPDYDNDGDVDQDDFAVWQSCFTGSNVAASAGVCATYADLDQDTDVDEVDFGLFEACATGPEVPYQPGVTCSLPALGQ